MTDRSDAADSSAATLLYAGVALAIAFQIHATVSISSNLLRVTLADLLAPLLLSGAVLALARGALSIPKLSIPGQWIWPAVLSGWMAVALAVGHHYAGTWQPWALFNKFVGWFVLIGFFVLGAVLGSVSRPRVSNGFLRTLFVAAWTIAGFGLVAFVLYRFGISGALVDYRCDLRPEASAATAPAFTVIVESWLPVCSGRLQGLMANPNALGIFLAVILTLQAPFMARGALFRPAVHVGGFAVLIAALVLTGSRSGWLGAIVGVPLLIYFRVFPYRRFAIAALTAAALLAVLLYAEAIHAGLGRTGAEGAAAPHYVYAFSYEGNVSGGVSANARLDQFLMAIDLWRDHPIVGAGLGGFLSHQVGEGESEPVVIHNSLLWLLTETGLVGALLFAAFFLLCLKALWPVRGGPQACLFRLGVAASLLTFAGASVGTEILYQRHLWFLLGWALAQPAGSVLGSAVIERGAEPAAT